MIEFLNFWPKGNPELNSRRCESGMSLLEVAMLMVILTVALAPMLKNLGGPTSANGNASMMVGTQSKEVLLANTLIEQALASNFSSFDCDGTFNINNPSVSFPTNGNTLTYPSNSRCVSPAQYNKALYYQWTVRNAAAPNAAMPQGNQYYNAVLNIYAAQTGGTPVLSLPTSFFYNASKGTTAQTNTGIVVIQDISGSMMWGKDDYDTVNSVGANIPASAVVASPYLRYRYQDAALGYNNPPNQLAYASGNNAFNNQLDIVSAQPTDDPKTPWDDRYLGKNILGGPNCQAGGAWGSANWGGSQLYSQNLDSLGTVWNYNWSTGTWSQTNQSSVQNVLQAICNRSPDWNTMMNDNVSRIEAARGSLLNFIVSMEADSSLYANTKLGFETFSSPNGAWGNDPSGQGYDVRVGANGLESVDANNRYANMRRQISWMNREGPGQINPFNGTNYTAPIQQAATMLFRDKTLNSRFILLVSDGAPNGPGDNHPQLGALATSIGNGTYPGANGQTATMFTLGLMSGDAQMPAFLRDDLANNTPGGQYFQANNVGDVSGIFDQIKYQIQKTILLNKSSRYNIDFS